MGTKYYVEVKKSKCCQGCICSAEVKKVLIGKSSLGWPFLFNPKFKSFREWKKFLGMEPACWNIRNEFNKEVTFSELIEIIESAQCNYYDNKTGDRRDIDGYRFYHMEDF